MTDLKEQTRAIVPAHFYPDFAQRQYPNVSIAGQRYAVVPATDVDAVRQLENELKNLKANRLGWTVFACLSGALGFGIIVAVLARFLSPQIVQVEKPVIVERQVPVNSNCVLFCGR